MSIIPFIDFRLQSATAEDFERVYDEESGTYVHKEDLEEEVDEPALPLTLDSQLARAQALAKEQDAEKQDMPSKMNKDCNSDKTLDR